MVKELHPRHVEIHDGVPNRLTAGRVQIHAIALAERIHATPSNPSLAEVVVVHTARPPVHDRVADMSAVGVVHVDALSGQCRAQSAHKADEHEQARRPYSAVDPTAEPLPEGHRLRGRPEELILERLAYGPRFVPPGEGRVWRLARGPMQARGHMPPPPAPGPKSFQSNPVTLTRYDAPGILSGTSK